MFTSIVRKVFVPGSAIVAAHAPRPQRRETAIPSTNAATVGMWDLG